MFGGGAATLTPTDIEILQPLLEAVAMDEG